MRQVRIGIIFCTFVLFSISSWPMSRIIPYCKKQDQLVYGSTSNVGPAVSALSSMVASGLVTIVRPGEPEPSEDTQAIAAYGGLFWMAAGLVSTFMISGDCNVVDDYEFQRMKESGLRVYEPDVRPPDEKPSRVATGLMISSLVYNLAISTMASTERSRKAIQPLALIPIPFLIYDYFARDEYGRKKSALAYWGIEPSAKMISFAITY